MLLTTRESKAAESRRFANLHETVRVVGESQTCYTYMRSSIVHVVTGMLVKRKTSEFWGDYQQLYFYINIFVLFRKV